MNYWVNRAVVFVGHYFEYATSDTFGDIQHKLLFYNIGCNDGYISSDNIPDEPGNEFVYYYCTGLITGIQAFS